MQINAASMLGKIFICVSDGIELSSGLAQGVYYFLYDKLSDLGSISRQLKKTSIMHLKLGIWAVKSGSFWLSGY